MIRALAAVAAVGVAIGAVGGWLWALPPTPWLEFHWLTAHYEVGQREIALSGRYTVNFVCPPDVEVIWRTEAIATDGQLALYGPKPGLPPLGVGNHEYKSSIPLLEAILPDGWVVRVIATCPGMKPDTAVSLAAAVRVGETPLP